MINAPVFGGISVARDFGSLYFRRRYAMLFYSLILTLVASPVFGALGFRGAVIDFLLAVNLAIGIVPVNPGPKRKHFAALIVVFCLARPITAWLGHPVLSKVTLGFWTLLGLFAAGVAVKFAMRGVRIDSEHLCAALSAYLLAGIYFGLLYWVIEQVHPASFTAAGGFTRTGALYFSFVTLATLGFGDIVPSAEITRGLAIVEGVGGQLFLAVLVARLVSLYQKPA